MEINCRIEGEVTVTSITGSIDGFTADELLASLRGHIQIGIQRLVVDLNEVDFISSAGLRVILTAQKQIREQNGDLRLAVNQPRVLKTLKLSGYTSIFKVFEDVPAAVASFDG